MSNKSFKPDDTDKDILKSIAGEKIGMFPCVDLEERIKKLKENGFIETDNGPCSCLREIRLEGNKFRVSTELFLTEKGKWVITVSNLLKNTRLADVCICGSDMDIVQRHTGKYQAICTRCGYRSPFYDDIEKAKMWCKGLELAKHSFLKNIVDGM